MTIRPLISSDYPELLALNNAHAAELSLLTEESFAHWVSVSFLTMRAEAHPAFLLAFEQNAPYTSPNFLWFQQRMPRFVYVDRIVVGAAARGLGLARILYQDLFLKAKSASHDRIVCEVNSNPPNPGSDAFHAALGFTVVGEAYVESRGKSVRYLQRIL